MRDIYVAGNWKMNKTYEETKDYLEKLQQLTEKIELNSIKTLLFPPSLYLQPCSSSLKNSAVKLGAQDVSEHTKGAYTGEISALMLKSIGIDYSLAGHSERRQYHNEDDELINRKAKAILAAGLTPVICIGELEEEREKGITNDIIVKQLELCLAGLDSKDEFVIAYEPVWAIGTGKTATPEIAQEVHSLIREKLKILFNADKAEKISILYGGSVKVDNFAELLAQKDVDGGLIGGASLSADDFFELIKIALNQ